MEQAALYAWMLFVSFCFSVIAWIWPVLIAVGLLNLRRKLQSKPRQRAYTTAATAGEVGAHRTPIQLAT